jgi:hypothetical protein
VEGWIGLGSILGRLMGIWVVLRVVVGRRGVGGGNERIRCEEMGEWVGRIRRRMEEREGGWGLAREGALVVDGVVQG